jgi:hypothetical protein
LVSPLGTRTPKFAQGKTSLIAPRTHRDLSASATPIDLGNYPLEPVEKPIG